MLGKDIMFYEALALLHAVSEWEGLLDGGRVVAHINNQVLIAAINNRSCRHCPTQSLIRTIHHITMKRHMEIRATWLPSKEN